MITAQDVSAVRVIAQRIHKSLQEIKRLQTIAEKTGRELIKENELLYAQRENLTKQLKEMDCLDPGRNGFQERFILMIAEMENQITQEENIRKNPPMPAKDRSHE